MTIKFIKKYFGLAFTLAVGTLIIFHGSAFAGEYSPIIPEAQIKENSQTDVNLVAPNCVSGGYYSSICGKTAKEKYWSALRKYFDEIHAAAIMGNLAHEGDFGPTRWEIGRNVTGDGGTFKIPWNTLYNNCTHTSSCAGVGSFGLTYFLSPYLQYINSQDPSLLRYFSNPASYSFEGETALKRIGEADFNKLVELEVKFVAEEDPPNIIDKFKQYRSSNLEELTDWWTINYENCLTCCGGADEYKNCSSIEPRRQSAKKALEEFKNFSCGGSTSMSATPVSPSGSATDITLIGDSISVISEKALEEKFPTSFLNKVGSRHPTSPGSCPGDEGGLAILEKLANGSGVIVNQSADGCGFVSVSSDNLKNNVVWALGTNSIGAHEPSTIEKVINLIGDRRLFLVTPYNGDNMTDADTTAELYRSIANDPKNSNVFIVDWNQAVRDNPSTYLGGDQVHPTAEGSQLFAQLIFDAVSGTKGCTTYTGEYPEYSQGSDPRWKDKSYGCAPGKTFASSGCGAVSMAMLVTVATGRDVFPQDIADTLASADLSNFTPKYCGFSSSCYNDTCGDGMAFLDKKVCEKYGCEAEQVDYSSHSEFLEKAKEYLSNGYMLHMSAGCGKGNTCPPFSGGGHYIGIFSIKDDGDTVMVADSSHGNKEYSLKKDITPVMDAKYAFSAIRGPGGGGSCANLCKTSQISSDGLTEEQARKIALYYNSGNTDAEQYDLPHGKNNCVSFSKWFVMKFTGLSWAGGHGRDVAHTLAVTHGLPQGTEPRPYALFSTTTSSIMCDGYSCGHTGIVVAVDGNDVTTLEASYSSTGPGIPAHIEHRDVSYFKNDLWQNTFTYLDSVLDKTELEKIAGRQ